MVLFRRYFIFLIIYRNPITQVATLVFKTDTLLFCNLYPNTARLCARGHRTGRLDFLLG